MLSVTRIQSWLGSRTLVLGMLLCLLGAGWCQTTMAAISAAEPPLADMASQDGCPHSQPLQSSVDSMAGGADCDNCGDSWSPGRDAADFQPWADPGVGLLPSSIWPVAEQTATPLPILYDPFLSRPARPLFLVFGHFLE